MDFSRSDLPSHHFHQLVDRQPERRVVNLVDSGPDANPNLVSVGGPERTQFATRKHPSLDAPEQGLVEGLERRGAL